MKHYPIFLDLSNQRVVVSGAGETALAKLRLLLKTEAKIEVFGVDPSPQVLSLATENRLKLFQRPLKVQDLSKISLVYAANDSPETDTLVADLARSRGILVNIVDNLADSDFITPAIVDRDPVTIAIGTEGTAPVLARQIKAQIEEILPTSLGVLARLAQTKRKAAGTIPQGRARRAFWSEFFFSKGPRAFTRGDETEASEALDKLLLDHAQSANAAPKLDLVGAGTGDPELLTLKARRSLHQADVVLYDPKVSDEILDLARREAIIVPTKPANVKNYIQEHMNGGLHVIWLQPGNLDSLASIGLKITDKVLRNVECSIIPGVPIPQTFETTSALFGDHTDIHASQCWHTTTSVLPSHDLEHV